MTFWKTASCARRWSGRRCFCRGGACLRTRTGFWSAGCGRVGRLCAGVSVARIRTGDFAAARVRGAFSHYRKPLHLARAVLESTGFALGDEGREFSAVVPFALNSAELFERWAQLKLLESPMFSGVEAGGKHRTTYAGEGGNVSVRPDFWIPARDGKEGMILDAKYKLAPESVADIQDKDIYQMVAYSRHRRFVEEKLGAKPGGFHFAGAFVSGDSGRGH